MFFIVSLSRGKPWFMNVCVTYMSISMILLPCCRQKFFKYCFGVVLLIFIPRALMQENKFSHFFKLWEYGMHNFFWYKILFWMYLCNSKQMHLQIYTRKHRLLKERSQLWLGDVLIFLPCKWLQCVKLLQNGFNGRALASHIQCQKIHIWR